MGNENEDAPVLNVDETASGDALVNASGEEEKQVEETASGSEENKEPQVKEFDAAAFGSTEQKEVDSSEENKEVEGSDSDDITNDSDDMSWDDLAPSSDDTTPADKADEVKDEAKDDVVAEKEIDAPVVKTDFKEFVSELGIEAESMDEVKDVLERLVEENAKLKEQNKEPVSNKRIEDLNNFLKLDDENLVRKSFEADGLKGEKLDNVVDRLLDSGMMEVEALKIRNNVDQAIATESQNEIKAEEAKVAKQQESHTEAVQKFDDFMQSTDSLFGFKLTGNTDKLPDVRKSHTEYVTSGEYLNEITANERNLAESSWLWRNRETLKNAMINNGRQNGRKEILDQIGRPDSGKPSRFVAPDTGEFNPKKFTQTN